MGDWQQLNLYCSWRGEYIINKMMWDIAFAFPIIISTDFLTLKNLFRWLYSDSAPPLNPTRAALTLNLNEEMHSKSISFFKHSKSKENPFALTRQWCIFTLNTASCSACTVKQQAWLLLSREHVHCVDWASPAAARGIVMPLLCLYNVAKIRKYCHFLGGGCSRQKAEFHTAGDRAR